MSKSKKVTIGYWYHLSVHMILCKGPVDAIRKILVGERTAWEGTCTGNESLSIRQRELHGGEKSEGGVYGLAHVLMGAPSQARNEYLAGKQGADCPAYRGVTSILFTGAAGFDMESPVVPGSSFLQTLLASPWASNAGFTWAANNRYFKSVWVDATRIFSDWYGPVWYSARAAIGPYDMNPAHIIYQALTDPRFGCGVSIADIDDASFRAAADTLYAEGFGLSVLWDNPGTGEEFIRYIIEHIHGSLIPNFTTGRLELKLTRADYVLSELPTLTPDDCVVEDYVRGGWSDVVNKVTVNYLDRDGNEQAVSVSDPSSISVQGVVESSVDYRAVREPALAIRLAQRDLNLYSQPLGKFSIRVNRKAYKYVVGQLFKLNWPALGINQAVLRVLEVDAGTFESGYITVEAMEDIFGMPSSSYAATPPSSFVPPSNAPAPVTQYKLTEASYIDLFGLLDSSDIQLLAADATFVMAFGRAPSTDSSGFDLWSSATTPVNSYGLSAVGNFTPYARLAAGVGPTDTTLQLTDYVGLGSLVIGSYGYLDDELIAISSGSNGTLVVRRGCQDTVPARHSAGAEIFFYSGYFYSFDPQVRTDAGSINYRYLTNTSEGTLDINDAPARSITLTGRQIRPYPPGQFRINGLYYPEAIVQNGGALTVSWAHRDRTQQTTGLVDYTAGSIGPEQWQASSSMIQRTEYVVSINNSNTGAPILTLPATQHTRIDIPEVEIARALGLLPAGGSGIGDSALRLCALFPGAATVAHVGVITKPVVGGGFVLDGMSPASGLLDHVRRENISGNLYFEVYCIAGSCSVGLGYTPQDPLPDEYSPGSYPFGLQNMSLGGLGAGGVLKVAIRTQDRRYWVTTGEWSLGYNPATLMGGSTYADVGQLDVLIGLYGVGTVVSLNSGNLPTTSALPGGYTWLGGGPPPAAAYTLPRTLEVRLKSRLLQTNGETFDSWQSHRHIMSVPVTHVASGGLRWSGSAPIATFPQYFGIIGSGGIQGSGSAVVRSVPMLWRHSASGELRWNGEAPVQVASAGSGFDVIFSGTRPSNNVALTTGSEYIIRYSPAYYSSWGAWVQAMVDASIVMGNQTVKRAYDNELDLFRVGSDSWSLGVREIGGTALQLTAYGVIGNQLVRPDTGVRQRIRIAAIGTSEVVNLNVAGFLSPGDRFVTKIPPHGYALRLHLGAASYVHTVTHLSANHYINTVNTDTPEYFFARNYQRIEVNDGTGYMVDQSVLNNTGTVGNAQLTTYRQMRMSDYLNTSVPEVAHLMQCSALITDAGECMNVVYDGSTYGSHYLLYADSTNKNASSALTGTGDFTLELWFRYTDKASGLASSRALAWINPIGGSPQLRLSFDVASRLFTFTVGPDSVTWTAPEGTTSQIWHVVASRGANNALTLAINGAQVATQTFTASFSMPAGVRWEFVSHPEIHLDCPAIYRKVLSGARALAHYNAGTAANSAHTKSTQMLAGLGSQLTAAGYTVTYDLDEQGRYDAIIVEMPTPGVYVSWGFEQTWPNGTSCRINATTLLSQ